MGVRGAAAAAGQRCRGPDGRSPSPGRATRRIDFISSSTVGNAGGIALNGKHLYWGNANGGTATTVARVNLNGTGVNNSFITGGQNPCGIPVISTRIYWAGDLGNFIGRANLNGTGKNASFITGTTGTFGAAVTP